MTTETVRLDALVGRLTALDEACYANEEAEKELAQLRADAARYRWLRIRHAPHRHEVNFWTGIWWDVLEGEKLDASIDAARTPNRAS